MRDALTAAAADTPILSDPAIAGRSLTLSHASSSVESEARRLTDQQALFVVHYTSTVEAIGNASAAARRAGYSCRSAAELGRQLLEKPHIQDAVREANKKQIGGKIATKAIALLARVIDDESVPMRTRVDAAKAILDRGGFCAMQQPPKRLHDKSMSEMTADELREVMRQAREEMNLARVINHDSTMAEQPPSRGKGES